MTKQFADVSSRYGAPMGRSTTGTLSDEPRSVSLFRVKLDSGGYDDGGAYWGLGPPSLYCAVDDEGGRALDIIAAGVLLEGVDRDLALLVADDAG